MTARVWFQIFILTALLVLLAHGSLELSARAMAFPWALGALGCIMLTWAIVRDIRRPRQRVTEAVQQTGMRESAKYAWRTAWLVAILPMTYVLGFLLTIPLYTFLSMKLNGEKWLLSIVLTAVVGAFFYVVFSLAMEVRFYEGLLFSYAPD